VGIVVDKVAVGQVFSEYSVSHANLHSTNYSTITITIIRGWYNMPVSGSNIQSSLPLIKKITKQESYD
jgi:hypothetical protein